MLDTSDTIVAFQHFFFFSFLRHHHVPRRKENEIDSDCRSWKPCHVNLTLDGGLSRLVYNRLDVKHWRTYERIITRGGFFFKSDWISRNAMPISIIGKREAISRDIRECNVHENISIVISILSRINNSNDSCSSVFPFVS